MLQNRADAACRSDQMMAVAALAGRAFAIVEIDFGGDIFGAAMDAGDLQLRPAIGAAARRPGDQILTERILIAFSDMIVRTHERPPDGASAK